MKVWNDHEVPRDSVWVHYSVWHLHLKIPHHSVCLKSPFSNSKEADLETINPENKSLFYGLIRKITHYFTDLIRKIRHYFTD